MRSCARLILALGVLATPLPVLAQSGQATAPAPVPSVPPPTRSGPAVSGAPVPSVPPEQIAPADRAGGIGGRSQDAGPTNATPFSSTPSGSLSGGSQVDPGLRHTSPGDATTPPNLSH